MPSATHSISHQQSKQTEVRCRPCDVQLHRPKVMDDSGCCAEINEPMNLLPSFSTEPADPLLRRREGERDQNHEAQVTGHDESSLRQIFDHLVDRKELIEPHVSHKV